MKMKKMILAVCMMAVCQMGQAQSVDALFREFKDEANAEYVHLPKMLMKLGAKVVRNNAEDADDRLTADLVKKIEAVRVLDLDDCPSSVKSRFVRAIAHLDTAGYEEIVRVNDEGARVRVMTKSKDDRIREIVVVNGDGEDCQLVQLKVNVSPEDVDRLLSNGMVKIEG